MSPKLRHCVPSSRKLENLYDHESSVWFKSIASHVNHLDQEAKYDVERYKLDLEKNGMLYPA
jgi:hypothetical protein